MTTSDKVSRPVRAGDHVFLVDGSGFIFRAYHALPPLTRKSDGVPVGAVSGFCNMLWRLLKETEQTVVTVKPTHLAIILDASSQTFRNRLYPAYKAHRPEPPEDLRPQFGLIRHAVRAFNIACIEQHDYEADDLIATYTRLATEAGADVTIVSSDKDLMQLIRPGVMLYDTMKDKRIGAAEVFEKFGVAPDKVVDVQSLAGDSVDNVPGVPGIGIKTAAGLIAEYGDLDTLLARAGEIRQPKRRESLIGHADAARISRELVRLETGVPLTTPIEDTGVRAIDGARAIAFLKAMEFSTLTRRVGEATGVSPAAIPAAGVPVDYWPPGSGPAAVPPVAPAAVLAEPTLEPEAPAPTETSIDARPVTADLVPARLAGERRFAAATPKIDPAVYPAILSLTALDALIAEARATGIVAFDTETTSLQAMSAELVGFSLCARAGAAAYVPLAHKAGTGDLLGGGPLAGQIALADALDRLKPLLEDPAILKIGQNIKYDALVLRRYGMDIVNFDDTMLISYALDAGRTGHGMDELSEKLLGHKPISFREVAGSGKSAVTFDLVALDKATAYAAEDADITLRLWQVLKPRLVAEKMTTVYETLERPLVPVLVRMEAAGISVDRQILSRLSGEFAQGMARLENEIGKAAGESFNLASPKQLGDILFGKFGLPGGRKTKTGAWSTDSDVLEELAAQGYDLPRLILDWRGLAKLKSTYTDALPGFIQSGTRRVHTSYSMASTTTGRLASSDPNLQNIPVRTDAGRRIRTAFVAEPGHRIISADYSQIELRVLAHVADITQLKRAFAEGLDIHAMTASEMFGVPVKGMDPAIRRRAKAINFGIIYGISAFGLANQLGIARGEAGDYIRRYFERFPGIRDYMEETRASARKNGYVTTIFGRKAHYPEIASSNPSMRAFMERAAINAPIQGSAADIIRRAMVRMEPALAAAGLSARMLLQVHDELLFEVPEAEVAATLPVVAGVMREAPLPAVTLSVPLEVDARAAANWDEAH